jgi:uncharacterized protein (DUF58 family)
MVPTVVPTVRLVRWIAIGSPLWLLALATPAGWIAGAAYMLVLTSLCVMDYFSVPGTGGFEIQRSIGRLSLGAVTDVHIQLTNLSTRDLIVSMRDELPPALQQQTPIETVHLPERGECDWKYEVRSRRRGKYHLDRLVLRAGRIGALIEKELRIPAPADFRVYPRFATADEYRLLARIHHQDEAMRRPRRVHGHGTDFESLLTYSPGEDLRTVDWKVSAKRGFLVSRNLQTERGQQISIMIDGGRRMAEQIGEYSRFEYALHAAVMLSNVAQRRGDTVAVSTFSDRVESFMPPTRGAAVMRTVLESLSTVEVRQVETDYWQVVGQVMDRLKRRSLLVMMTDVLDSSSSSGLLINLARAASRHLVLCVVLTEPRIAKIAESEPETLQDAFVKAAAAHTRLQRHLALETMQTRGIMVLETSPDQLTIQLIRRYLEVRRANLQ